MRIHRAALITVLLASAACTNENRSPIKEVTLMPAPITAPAGEPNLARDANGTVFLTWIEQRADSTHALRLSILGDTAFAPATTIASGPNWFVNWADFPMLTVFMKGSLAAHWLQRSSAGKYSYDVMVAWSRDAGKTWSAPVTPHRDSTLSEHGFVSLFPVSNDLGANDLGVVWLDGRKYGAKVAEEMTVRFARIGWDGALGPEREIDPRACDCCQTSVAVTSAGPLLVYRDRSADEIRDIYYTRYVDTREVKGEWTEPRPVHNDGWKVDFCPVNGPSVAAREDRAAVAWFTAADSLPRVYVAFSEDAGATFGPPIQIDEGSPLGRVDVQLHPRGGALVSWLEQTGGSASILVRRVLINGKRSAATAIAKTSGERPSGFPHMIIRKDDVIFAWTQPGSPATVRVARAELR